MEQDFIFKEKQRFKQWWLWLILLGLNGFLLYGFFRQVLAGYPLGDRPMSNIGLSITALITLLLSLFFIILRLETIIKTDGIYVRFFPFHAEFKYYPWSRINRSHVRTYAPLAEYGGWGLRYGMFGKGTAFNVSGNQGLQLEFTDRKKLLIGTNKPEALSSALRQLGQLN